MNQRIQRWFMPWRWSRWTWAGVVLLQAAPIVYLLAPIPVIHWLAHREDVATIHLLNRTFFYPAIWCSERSILYDGIQRWQMDKMDEIFGMPVVDWGGCGYEAPPVE